VDHIARRRAQVERFELLRNRVQAGERAAVVVFVVTLDEALRESVQRPGTSMEGRNVIAHGETSKTKSNGIRIAPGPRATQSARLATELATEFAAGCIGARARRDTFAGIGRGTVLEGVIPGVLLTPCIDTTPLDLQRQGPATGPPRVPRARRSARRTRPDRRGRQRSSRRG